MEEVLPWADRMTRGGSVWSVGQGVYKENGGWGGTGGWVSIGEWIDGRFPMGKGA